MQQTLTKGKKSLESLKKYTVLVLSSKWPFSQVTQIELPLRKNQVFNSEEFAPRENFKVTVFTAVDF